jgi:peptidoglycan/xylan/chitin deacetylase (PgdA/CDA1 family)
MRVPGRTTAIRGARWLRSRSRERALLIGYHRIADPALDVYGLSVSPAHFAQQMDVLARLTQPTRLREMVTSVSRGVFKPNTVVVTFDDGYAETLDVALPILERAGIPATVFAVSGYLGREFWWDELARLVRAKQQRNGESLAEPRNGASAINAAGLRALPEADRRRSLTALANGAPACAPVRRALTVQELARLARSDLIEVGAHTVTHPLLPRLSQAEQRCELEDCRRTLEAIVGRPVFSFSYPHGAFSETTTRLVREAAYTAACCSTPDVATQRSDLLALPRFWAGDWDGDRFERFLRRWLLV